MGAPDEHLIVTEVESAQPRAFTASELVDCPACSRSNPPTRANCLYCGVGLGITSAAETVIQTPRVAQPETENIIHVVVPPNQRDELRAAKTEFVTLLNLTPSEFDGLMNGTAAPLYSNTANHAQAISDKLRTAGIEPLFIPDEQLKLATPAKEIAALTIADDSLHASVRRTGERICVRWDDVALLVVGRLCFTTTEVEQKSNQAKDVIGERQLTSDEAVLDIYSRDDAVGSRIRAGSFDFSCLGVEKKMTVFENFRWLVDLLRRQAPNAVFDDYYLRMRAALNKVWPPEARASTSEKRRAGIRHVNATATVTDNELQFTRYSRLLRLFQLPEFQDDARQP